MFIHNAGDHFYRVSRGSLKKTVTLIKLWFSLRRYLEVRFLER